MGLSSDGKSPTTRRSLNSISENALKRLYLSIERNNNKVNITNVSGNDLPSDIDILTYSFPCQDLSICGFWHGNTSGIDRQAYNRSGMLWEIERILHEMVSDKIQLPRILLMENVSNILSNKHKKNFQEWKEYLNSIGYYNHVYKLNSKHFGIPQNRERVFMISILSDEEEKFILKDYFERNNLEDTDYSSQLVTVNKLESFLRTDYSNERYRTEANLSQPNFTKSRKTIFDTSKILFDGKGAYAEIITTITTKQDRNPNSGLLVYEPQEENKAPYRNLTGRECLLLMGFEEDQVDKLLNNNFYVNKTRKAFINNKLIKMAGNSIVVQVLEQIFKQIKEIDDIFLSYRNLKKEAI
jgi:DNA (cytosine-5)-methyltransferase 1